MTRQDNERLHALDRRLEAVYGNAFQTINRREQRAIQRVAAIKADTTLPEQMRELQLRSALARLDRETGLTNNIAAELARSRDTAARMINGESLNLFMDGYRSTVNALQGQAAGMGLHVNWSMIERNELNAIFNGENTQLAQLPGYQGAFTQVGFRQEWARNNRWMWDSRLGRDRLRGQYFYNRALGRLGDNADIVRRLQNSLAEGIILGESIPKIATRIRAITEGCRKQAVRIARTETIRAANQGRYLAAYQAQEQYGLPLNCRCSFSMRVKRQENLVDNSGGSGIMESGDGQQYSQAQEEDVRRDVKEQIREQIRSDAVNKELNTAHQDRHFRDSGGYIEGRSYFYQDVDPATLIEKYHGTGEIRFSRAGNWTNKEFIFMDRDIGVHIDGSAGIESSTNGFSIHYSKRGAHIVPARPRRRD